MRIGGIEVTKPSEEVLVIPRDPEPIVFRAQAIEDFSEFNKLCPEPEPAMVMTKDGMTPDTNSTAYKEQLEKYYEQRGAYIIINTLAPSGIEWEKVKLNNPKTWPLWAQELKDAGLTQVEVSRVSKLALDANCLNEDKLVKARELFLHGRAQVLNAPSSQSTAPETTPSGGPA